MSGAISRVLLWLFVINLGIAFGAGIYEGRIVVSQWVTVAPNAMPHWNADAARRDDTGLPFWVFVTTIPLTLLAVTNLIAAWLASGPARVWWLGAALAALADRAFTFCYFIPRMVRLMNSGDSPESASAAMQWVRLNYVRHALVLIAWLGALKAFALVYQHSGPRP
jgi:hypothetical protein